MSRVVRRKKNMQKNRFKTVLIVLAVAVCLFIIYKFNFTTRSEVEVTTPVKFKEFESENELQANIPVLEDDNGKYIILPEKVNGIFTSAYYLSGKNDIVEKENDNTDMENTTLENTISNTTIENNISDEILENTTSNNNTVKNEVSNQINEDTVTNTANEITNSTEKTNTINNSATNETANNKVENEIVEDNTQDEEIKQEKNIEEQIEALNESESLFDKVTKDSEEYADKLEEIAESNNKEDELPAENNETEEKTEQLPADEEQANEEEKKSEEPVKEVLETGNEIITQKLETMPGEKYYLSKEELENEDLELTVKFQMVEINGVQLYNQEFTADMINAVIKLTCYTPLGYYLDVKDEDVNNIQELKSDVESLAKSETVLAYDIKITNGEKEYQPEDYYQVATVSITKPEVVDFKSNSHSLQLLHIKENEEEVAFEKMEMTKVENDGFEFLTNEFSIYAVILYAVDQGDLITINDYESDKNYYLGRNYTDYMAGYDTKRYTEDNLAQVNINYYSYDPDQNLNTPKSFTTDNCKWEFNPTNDKDTVMQGRNPVVVGSRYTITTSIEDKIDSYVDKSQSWSMEFVIPTTLRYTFTNSFDLTKTRALNPNMTLAYDINTYTLTVSGQNMNNWESLNQNNSFVGPYKVSFRLYFNGDIAITNFVPTSQKFSGTEKILVGTTSIAPTEQHVLYSYVKCLPIKDGVVNVELIDNPFINRPAGFGFNGWLTKEDNSKIKTDSETYLQTLKRTLTAEELASKQVDINVYVDWKEASVVFVNATAGNNNNDGLTLNSQVQNWTGIQKNLKKLSTETASSRELNIVVLTNGSLGNLSNNTGSAYTITSVYNGIDYRNSGYINLTNNFTANYDIQMEFIRTYNTTTYNTDAGTGTIGAYISGGSRNFRVGRGVYSSRGNGYTAISQIFGGANGTTRNYRTVIESGYYNNIQVVSSGSSNIQTSAILVLGSEIDRVNNNNNDLKVNYRVASTAFGANIYTSNINKPATCIIVKSGEFGFDGYNYYRNNRNTDYAYAGIYVGGHGSNSGSFYGDRDLIVEGGRVCNIIGGLKMPNYLSSKTHIYVKDGEVRNIVGGAGVSVTRGDRMIQVTGGNVEYSVSGGSNGFVANSTSNNGELIGNTLVYIGGNAVIGSETAQYDELYYVAPGSVCGAGNGTATYSSSGKVNSSHVIIDGDAIINNSVYGGGNYGFVAGGATKPTDITNSIPDPNEKYEIEDFSGNLTNGETYILATGTLVNSDNAMYYRNNTSIRYNSLQQNPGNTYYWTYEENLADNTFYLKYGNSYLVAPTNNGGTAISYTTNRANATKFTYTSAQKIQYTSGRNTLFLRFGNNSNVSSTNSNINATTLHFLKIKKIESEEKEDPDIPPVMKEFEVDTIDIIGGTVKNSVYGGANQNRIIGNVDINILGGSIEGTVYGGSNTTGNIEGNVDISIEGGAIGSIVTQDAVFGGGYGSNTNINKNVNLTIKDTANNIHIAGNVYGGGALGNIKGTTTIKVEDHYLDDFKIAIIGNLFGGGKGVRNGTSPTSEGNITVNVDGGTYENLDVYGGYNANGTIPNRAVAVNIGQNYKTTINDVYGSGNQAAIANTTTSVIVKMFENAYVNNAYNGGNNAGINGNNTREIHAIGAHIKNLFGGSNNSGALNFTNVYVTGKAEIENVFGGGNNAEITTNTNVDILESTVMKNVYGGGNNAAVGRYTEVDIQNSKIKNVYGGGNAGTVDSTTPPNRNSTNVNISKESEIETVYGGGCSASIKVNSNVYIENSTITNVYGGGEGDKAIVEGDTSVNLQRVQIDEKDNKIIVKENVYGGGDLGKVNGNSVIVMNEANVEGSVYGGGNKADIQNNASVFSEKSIASNIYGGGMNGEIGGSTSVTVINKSIVNNNVFGGGSKGKVSRNTVVTLDDSKVKNDLFGGGEAAGVNGTAVSLINNAEVKNVYGGGDNGITTEDTKVTLKDVNVIESAFGAGNGAPAIVIGKSYISAAGTTTIGKSLFAGGNNSSTGLSETNPNADLANKPLAKASAVADIAGATIGENVYGGANTSVIYGDVAVNIGNEAIKSYYTSIKQAVPTYTSGKINIGGTIYGGGEQMDPNKEYNYDTVSVEGYIKINIDGTGYTSGDNTLNIMGSIFGSGHASRAGLPTSYIGDIVDGDQTAGYITINGDVNIKNYGSVKAPKSMVSIQRCKNVVLDKSALWISGATDSTNTHSATYFSFNHIDTLKLKNDSTLYLRATSNLLKSFYSVVDINGKEEKATVKIINEITGEDGKSYEAVGNYIYDLFGNIEYVLKSGQIFTADKDGNALELVTDIRNSKTKSIEKNVDNRVYMYSGLNLNISSDENLGDDTWGPVEGMTFFGIFNTSNTDIDKDENVDISQTTDTNNDFSTIHTGIYDVDYSVSDTTPVKWNDRNYNRSYVEGKHVKSPQEQDIQKDGFYTNYEKFGIPYGDDEEIEEGNYDAHNPTSYTDYIVPTPDETNYYIWYAGPDQDFYYYDLALIASKLSTYGTIEKTLQGISVANATFKITGVDSSLINGAALYEKSKISNINTTGNPNREFALAMKTGGSGWSMNGETDFVTSPNVNYSGTQVYKTENSNTTPTLGFYLYHSNNISEEQELGFFTINMILYYWKTPTQQAKARVTIDVAIATKVYEDLGYDASITPGRQYELFPRTNTNITTKSSFSAYFQLHEKDFANNKDLKKFFSHKEYADDNDIVGVDVIDTKLIEEFIKTNYRLIKTDYVFPEDTTITMIDKSTDNPTYYYYTVTEQDNTNKKKSYRLSEFKKMGSTSEIPPPDTAEYYSDDRRSEYVTTVNENGTDVTYQSENFIFIVDFESAKFKNIDTIYEVVKNQTFHLVLTSDVKNKEGEALEISVLEEYKERNSISFGIYNTESTIKIAATLSPNKIYVGDSTEISIETNYITENKDPSNVTIVYDTRYFDSKLGVKITIFDEAGDVVHGANLLGAYFKITEADGTTTSYYPRTDGTTRMKIADKVSNSKATISFETEKSALPTGTYKFLIESFGSADGVYFGVESSDSTELTLSIINDEFGLDSEIPSNYVIVDKETGYTIEDTTGFNVEKEYEILDDNGNVIGDTTEELNDGKNDFEFSVKYSSGYENPYIAVSMYRRNYDSVYDRTYSLVDLADYLDIQLNPVPDNIKEQFVITDYDDSGNETKKYVGYEAYGIDFINKAVEDAIAASPDPSIRPIIKLTTKCSLREKLVSGTYKLVFTLYDKSEVEKIVEIVNEDGTITAELQKVIEYQRIGDTYSYVIIK